MLKSPVAFNGNFSQMGGAPPTKEDWSKGVKTPMEQAKEQEFQRGGGEWMGSPNAHSQIHGSPLPCGCYERIKYKPNKPQCQLWNTLQCGYGCGSCAGSDACLNYPFSYATQPSDFSSGNPAPICNLQRSVDCGSCCGEGETKEEQEGSGKPLNYGPFRPNQKVKCCNNNLNRPYDNNAGWYSQQCPCSGCGSDCAGSGTVYGCSQCGGSGCKDCEHYTRKNIAYRHMLTGTMYPFC